MTTLRVTPLLLMLLLCAALAPAAQAGWIWSPQTGWIGPSGAATDSPEEQLAFGLAFFEKKEYDKAKRELKKLLKHYKQSPEAAEAQYYLGRCEEEEGDYYKAFLEYRKTVQTYPSTDRFEEILELEYRIGNYFLSGKKRKLFGTAAILPAGDKAVEVFRAIVDDGPFSEHGQLAQYKLGLAHLALADYEAAVAAFEQLISSYPSSALVDDARFQIAQASLKGTFHPSYDQAPTEMAIRELQAFVREYPGSELAKDAEGRLESLQERRAQHEYDVAKFYEERKEYSAALIYYEMVIQQYAQTSWASQAAERVQALQENL